MMHFSFIGKGQQTSCPCNMWFVVSSMRLVIGLLALTGLAVSQWASAQNVQVLADSFKEYSSTAQGENNWFYGYYPDSLNRTFQLMTAVCSEFGGTWGTQCPPWNDWIVVDAIGGSPGSQAWSVRRWVSEVSGEVTISGRLAKGDWDCGNGAVGYIIVDGQEVWSQFVDYFNSVGVWYSVNVQVNVGSTVDFAIDPAFGNACDHAVFSATISRELPPGDTDGDGHVNDRDLATVLSNFGR